jgi:hypothetical protein
MAETVPMSAGGIQDSSLGNDYQFDLLLLCAHQSVESGIKFKLSTEQKDAGKFDDLVLKIKEKNGKTRYIFGQAKHKENAGNLDFQTIMESNNFKMSKYFESWDEILMKYGNTEKDILIITNNRIDTQKTLANGLIKIDSNDKKSPGSLYFAEETSNDLLFKIQVNIKNIKTKNSLNISVVKFHCCPNFSSCNTQNKTITIFTFTPNE